ncbi:hypothetical protein M0R04_15030 [Candidatus Dojkabacteria bacterium]|jgi:hypothetical protein|nr:hypothetical protein [Candidatus Dojkabacteria bacterium]
MSAIIGRTTTKQYTIGQLFDLYPCSHIGTFIPAFEELLLGSHPLPPMFAKQASGGNCSLLGEYSINLLYSAFKLYTETDIPHHRRRIAAASITMVIAERGQYQNEVILAYQDAKLI